MNRENSEGRLNDCATDTIAFVRKEIHRWRDKGLISHRLAERLLAEYEPKTEPESKPAIAPEDAWPKIRIPLTPGMVLLYLGGLLIVSAAIMLLHQVWVGLGEWGRFALILLPTGALYGFGARLHVTQPNQRIPALVMLFFACLLAPFALWLGGDCLLLDQQYPLREIRQTQAVVVAILTLAIHLGTLYRFRSPLLTILYPLSFIWVTLQSMDLATTGMSWGEWRLREQMHGVAMLVAGLLLVAVGIYHVQQKKPAYAIVPDLVGAFCALGALVFLGAHGSQPVWEMLALLLSLAALAASVYRKNQRYLFVGALFLTINIFSLGFEYFEDTVGLPITLVLCGGISMALGYGVQRIRKEYLVENE